MISFLKQTFTEFFDDNCMRMAAALAYYTVFALPPLFVILLMILGTWYQATGEGGQAKAQRQLKDQVTMFVGEAASDEVAGVIEQAGIEKGAWWRWLLSIGGVLFGATGLVAALQETLNEAWEVRPDPNQGGVKNFLMKRVFSLGMILGMGFILLVSTILTHVVAEMFGAGNAVLAAVLSFVVVTILFLGMFKYVPDAVVRWKDALIGAVVTALLFVVGKYALSMYLSQAQFASFGSAAALAVLLAWVYYSSLILLYGAEFTQVYARRYGGGITPEPGAVAVVKTTRPAPPANA